MSAHPPVFDVVIIGAGVVGCAIARELSQYTLSVALIEAQNDVGKGTSKANTAILHTGFDTKPDSLESRLLRRGYRRLLEYAPSAGIPIERLGAILIAWDETQAAALDDLWQNANRNGVIDAEIVSADEIYRLEPNLGSGAIAGMKIPGESIICPFTPPLAFATEAVVNGVTLIREFEIAAIERQAPDFYALRSANDTVCARFIINAAGLHADTIDLMLGHETFHVTPRRGELIVFDKLSRPLVNHVLLPVPTAVSKGVLVSPTTLGNVLLGPTAQDIEDKHNTNTTADGIAALLEAGRRIMPALIDYEVTSSYTGLRAATEHRDYQITAYPDESYICVGGIRSTGLSASMGIAEYVVELLTEQCGLTLSKKPDYQRVRMPNIGEAFERPYQSTEAISRDPAYGQIICFCERVTLGEIRHAMSSPLPPRDLDGLRRRTRAQLGRCQGFHCSATVKSILDTTLERSAGEAQ